MRLQRLEKVRAVAKQAAAREAAKAESTLAQLEALATRTGQLLGDYAARIDVADGAALQNLSRFRSGLSGVGEATRADALRARSHADAKLAHLAEAERRRQAVEDRAKSEATALGQRDSHTPQGARRQSGTGLE
ncbi:hypothetical protein C0V78_12625 [Novosphingobium sp. TH158]|nr:hypothetical protein C0V78_12625 [Novosphingobium sp. TH158]